MSGLPEVKVNKPKRSNVNLSNTNTWTDAIGVLTPVMVRKVLAGDNVSIDLSGITDTLPTISALYGYLHEQFDFFFCPDRLYNAMLHDDVLGFDPQDVKFPLMTLSYHVGNTNIISAGGSPGVHPSSLIHRLGIPEQFLDSSTLTDPDGDVGYRVFNAQPYLGYHDIVKNFYINTQENRAYFMTYAVLTPIPPTPAVQTVAPFPIENYDTIRRIILSRADSSALDISTNSALQGLPPFGNAVDWNAHFPLGGLALGTYRSGRFTSWLSTTAYDSLVNRSRVDTSAGFFTIDSFTFNEKLNTMLLKTLVAGSRYSSYLRVQYGSSPRFLSEVPRFLGSHSTSISFDIVDQTSASEDGSALASFSTRGRSSLRGRKIRHYCNEPGFIICIHKVTPSESYYQGLRYFYRHRTMMDHHIPELDGIGFQDLLTDEFDSSNTPVDAFGEVTFWNAIGKQPAWIEYMTEVDEVHGEFAAGFQKGRSHQVFARHYNIPDLPDPTLLYSSYIYPPLYNQNFADASLTSENLWCRYHFRFVAKRAISKRLMRHL